MVDIAVGVIVSVDVPCGVTIGGGGTVAVLPPPQPAVLNNASSVIAAKAVPNAKPLVCAVVRRSVFLTSHARNIMMSASIGRLRTPPRGVRRGAFKNGNSAALPLVVTVTDRGAGLPFESCSVEGT